MTQTTALFLLFCLALPNGSMASDTQIGRRKALLAAKDRRIRAQIAREPGAVLVRLADGGIRRFPAAAATEAARGAALNAAFALGTTLRNSTVFIGPGTYVITSGLRGFTGTKLYGSGRDVTLIQMADGALATQYYVFRCVEAEDPLTGYRYASGCELRDVTLDVNRQNQLPGAFFGVGAQIMASDAVLSRVTCRNAGGNTFEELFCLLISASGGVSGTFKSGLVRNALIEECEVTSVAPGFDSAPISVTAITINGSYTPDVKNPGDGWIVNGRITRSSVHGIACQTGLLAFQVSAARQVVVEDCTTFDNHCRYVIGFYSDTGPLQRVSVSRNQFTDVDVGVRLTCDRLSYHQDTLIFANDVRFRNDAPTLGKVGVEYGGGTRTSGVRVMGNRLNLTLQTSASIGVNLDQVAKGLVLANTIDGFIIPVAIQASGETVVRGNTDAFGTPVAQGVGQQHP